MNTQLRFGKRLFSSQNNDLKSVATHENPSGTSEGSLKRWHLFSSLRNHLLQLTKQTNKQKTTHNHEHKNDDNHNDKHRKKNKNNSEQLFLLLLQVYDHINYISQEALLPIAPSLSPMSRHVDATAEQIHDAPLTAPRQLSWQAVFYRLGSWLLCLWIGSSNGLNLIKQHVVSFWGVVSGTNWWWFTVVKDFTSSSNSQIW